VAALKESVDPKKGTDGEFRVIHFERPSLTRRTAAFVLLRVYVALKLSIKSEPRVWIVIGLFCAFPYLSFMVIALPRL
jgi:hypothetical protein